MSWITKEGRTVDEARDAAIGASGLDVTDLDVEVVNQGAKGLFGLGGEPAVVRVRPKDEATDFRHAFRDDITPARDEGYEEPRRTSAVQDAASAASSQDAASAAPSDQETSEAPPDE